MSFSFSNVLPHLFFCLAYDSVQLKYALYALKPLIKITLAIPLSLSLSSFCLSSTHSHTSPVCAPLSYPFSTIPEALVCPCHPPFLSQKHSPHPFPPFPTPFSIFSPRPASQISAPPHPPPLFPRPKTPSPHLPQ